MNIRLDLDCNPTPRDIGVLQKGITNFNNEKLGVVDKEFCVYLRDEAGTIRGGLFAVSDSYSIYIILLWMEHELRNKGYGSKLMQAAEEEALKRNCAHAYVDTFSFQAEEFYRKLGYQPIGIINKAAFDYSRIFFKKSLTPSSELNCNVELIEPVTAENICREITRDLPEYFGIPEANERYAKGMLDRTSFAAKVDRKYVGMLTLEFPFKHNANIYWMAVKRDYQSKGIGSSLLNEAERYARNKGYQSITVETLSPKNGDASYLKTYQFYESVGFKSLFELNTYGPEFLMVYMQKTI